MGNIQKTNFKKKAKAPDGYPHPDGAFFIYNIMNWKKLKEFANSLDEKQLEKNVVLWREDEAISDINVERLAEDYYIDPDSSIEGCFALSDYVIDKEKVEESELKKVYDKGHPILWEIF